MLHPFVWRSVLCVTRTSTERGEILQYYEMDKMYISGGGS